MTKERTKKDSRAWLAELRTRLRILIPENRRVFAICMIISMVFWGLVKMSKTYVTSKPVDYALTIPQDKALSALPPSDLLVEIEGTGWNLMAEYFNRSTLRVPIDLRNSDLTTVNQSRLRAAVKSRLYSRDIEVVDLNYNEIVFQLEERVRKKVPVIWRGHIGFRDEYDLKGPVEVRPDSVALAGPVSRVEPVESIRTDSFVLENLQFSETLQLGLEALHSSIQLQPAQVELSVPVEQYTEWEQFLDLQVRNVPSDSIRVFPNRIRLSCIVGLSRFDSLSNEDFEVEIDLKDLPPREDKTTVPVRLVRKPEYVKHVQISPRSASFLLVQTKENE